MAHVSGHTPGKEEVAAEKVGFMKNGGWWLVPLVVLVAGILLIGMASTGRGGAVVGIFVLGIRLTAVGLVLGSPAGIVTSLIKKKPQWALYWLAAFVVGLIWVALLFFLQ